MVHKNIMARSAIQSGGAAYLRRHILYPMSLLVFISSFFLLGCEDPADLKPSLTSPESKITLGSSKDSQGNFEIQIVSIEDKGQNILQHGKVQSQFEEYWNTVNVRWGFRKKSGEDASKIIWVQKNKNYRDSDNQYYAADIAESDKHIFALQMLPKELLQGINNKELWEVVAGVQLGTQTEKLVATPLPTAAPIEGLSATTMGGFQSWWWSYSYFQGKKKDAPTGLRLELNDDGSVRASWDRASGDSKGYGFTWGHVDKPWLPSIVVSGDNYTIPAAEVLKEITIGERLEVKLRTIGSRNNPHSSWVRSIKLAVVVDTTPKKDAPTDLKLEINPDGSVKASWNRASGDSKGYEFTWGHVDKPWLSSIVVSGGTHTVPAAEVFHEIALGERLEVKLRTIGSSDLPHSRWVRSSKVSIGVSPPTQVKMALGGTNEDHVKVSWEASPNNAGTDVYYQVAWGATTDPWSEAVGTRDLSYIIPPENLSASGTKFEVRVRTAKLLLEKITESGQPDIRYFSDWVRISPIEISFKHPQTAKLRNPQSTEKYRASLTKFEVLSDSDAGSEAEFYGNITLGIYLDNPSIMSNGGVLWSATEDAPVSIREEGSKSYEPGDKSVTDTVYMAEDVSNYRNFYIGINAALWEDDNIGDDFLGSEFFKVGRLLDYIIPGEKDYTFTMSGDGNTVRITVQLEPVQ